MRKLTLEEVEVEITTEPDECGSYEDIRGSFATDDPVADAATAKELFQRLQRGDYLAWCGVIATVSWKGFSETASVWGCSLSSDSEVQETAELHALAEDALAQLNNTIAQHVESVKAIEKELS